MKKYFQKLFDFVQLVGDQRAAAELYRMGYYDLAKKVYAKD